MSGVTRRQLTNLLGALAVAGVLAALTFGLPAIDDALPAGRPVPAGQPYPVGAGVTVVPPQGAVLDVTGTRPGDNQGSVLFRLGPVQYSIVVRPFDGTVAAAAIGFRERITQTAGYQVTGAQLTITTYSGIAGLQGAYAAPGRGGRYAVFVSDGYLIEVTVSGADLDLGRTLPVIEASTWTLTAADPA